MSITKSKSLEEEFQPQYSLPVYTKDELRRFGERLEEFYEEKEVTCLSDRTKMETVRVLNLNRAMEAYGAIRIKRTRFGPSKHIPHDYVVEEPMVILQVVGKDREGKDLIERPTRKDLFLNKLDQFLALKAKRNYAKEKELEHYEQLAVESMNVESYDEGIDGE